MQSEDFFFREPGKLFFRLDAGIFQRPPGWRAQTGKHSFRWLFFLCADGADRAVAAFIIAMPVFTDP